MPINYTDKRGYPGTTIESLMRQQPTNTLSTFDPNGITDGRAVNQSNWGAGPGSTWLNPTGPGWDWGTEGAWGYQGNTRGDNEMMMIGEGGFTQDGRQYVRTGFNNPAAYASGNPQAGDLVTNPKWGFGASTELGERIDAANSNIWDTAFPVMLAGGMLAGVTAPAWLAGNGVSGLSSGFGGLEGTAALGETVTPGLSFSESVAANAANNPFTPGAQTGGGTFTNTPPFVNNGWTPSLPNGIPTNGIPGLETLPPAGAPTTTIPGTPTPTNAGFNPLTDIPPGTTTAGQQILNGGGDVPTYEGEAPFSYGGTQPPAPVSDLTPSPVTPGSKTFDWGKFFSGSGSGWMNLLGAGAGALSSWLASNAQVKSAEEANQLLWAMYQQNRADLGPYRDAGYGALGNLVNLTTPGNQVSAMQLDPGYNFRLREGRQGYENQLRAGGKFYSGDALKGIDRYNQNFASNEFTNIYNRNANLAGMGQNAVNSGVTASNFTGGQVANNITGAGNARASGYVGAGNAITGGIQDYMNYGQNQQLLDILLARSRQG